MELIPTENTSKYVFYLPHHGVRKESSTTTKLRVVFNASFKSTSGNSLNDELLVGPKLQADIALVLTQWRIYRFVYCADIAQMYRQILVHEKDRDFQRIFWRAGPSEPLREFRLNTVTFGVSSAPFLALRVLKQLASDDGSAYPLATPVLHHGLYIDDCLFGADDRVLARQNKAQLIDLLRGGGFELRKWASNDPELLSDVNPENHGLAWEKPIQADEGIKILGIFWNPTNDSFQFMIKLIKPTALTKRTLLSLIARIYDPLGWVSPQPSGFGSDVIACELHGFSDASQFAYSAAVYVRVLTLSGSISVSLLKGRTKVAPVKQICIPRLELCGALLLARTLKSIFALSSFSNLNFYCWTDATIVLHWLQKHPSSLKTFVANRVSSILTLLPDAVWRHVPSKDNPADLASRGILADELKDATLWFEGPSWLKLSPDAWPDLRLPLPVDVDREEKAVVLHLVPVNNPTLEHLAAKCSNWNRLIRCTAYLLRWLRILRGDAIASVLSAEELRCASVIWYCWLQSQFFPQEIRILKDRQPIPKRSSLRALNPFLDDHDVLRVGGRLQNSDFDRSISHPVVLRAHLLVRLLVERHHRLCLHGGVTLTLQHLRMSGIWILQAKKIIRSVIFHCMICARLKADVATQLMGSLPAARALKPSRAFLHSGVDYAGPVQVRFSAGRGHQSSTAYIAIFVCFAVKAIHLELVSDYSAPAFIAAFKRFVARRGLPTDMYSDRGTTFVGANSDLTRAFADAIANGQFHTLLAQDGISWHFLPPAAPHFGGLWEAGVKSVKFHLKRILKTHTPTFEELTTLLCEIESCLNSRTLAPLNDDVDSLESLTPGHFLISSALKAIPTPSLLELNPDRLTRWQMYRRMLERFWKLWSRDYLLSLQQRTKWQRPRENVSIGQLVLMRVPNLPPAKWPLARVIRCVRGDDGYVRVVGLRTADSEYDRPISQIILLPTNTPSE